MYRCIVEEYTSKGAGRSFDIEIKTEKFYELIGRYTVKYGSPDEVYNKDGYTELEFYQLTTEGHRGAIVSYCKIANGTNVVPITKPIVAKTSEPLPAIMQTLLNAGILN